MDGQKTYILTGATGFLGQRILKRLLSEGHSVICIGRPKKDKSFEDRIDALFVSDDEFTRRDLVLTVEASIEQENLSDFLFSNIPEHIDGIFHAAANMSFRDKDRETTKKTNVNGTQELYTFAKERNVEFYYVSTAFVHGNRTGTLYEKQLVRPAQFNNPYEESKFEAEKYLQNEISSNQGTRTIIFRPSVLVDRCSLPEKFFGFYTVIYSLYKLKKIFGRNSNRDLVRAPFFLLLSKHATLNMTDVDVASDWMIQIIQSDNRSNFEVFHITSPNPMHVADIFGESLKTLELRLPIIRTSAFVSKLFLSLIVRLRFIPFLHSPANTLRYFSFYITENICHDSRNTEKFIGYERTREESHIDKSYVRDAVETVKDYLTARGKNT